MRTRYITPEQYKTASTEQREKWTKEGRQFRLSDWFAFQAILAEEAKNKRAVECR